MSRVKRSTRAQEQNNAPVLKPLWVEFGLSDTSPSGLRYRVGDVPLAMGPVAGCPRERTWPPEQSMAGYCIWPGSFELPVVIEYISVDTGALQYWKPVWEHVSTQDLRAILLEHAEEVRLIQALERHIDAQREVA